MALLFYGMIIGFCYYKILFERISSNTNNVWGRIYLVNKLQTLGYCESAEKYINKLLFECIYCNDPFVPASENVKMLTSKIVWKILLFLHLFPLVYYIDFNFTPK